MLITHGSKILGTGTLPGVSENKHLAMVQWLLDHGADDHETSVRDYGDRRKGKDERIALHKAVANGDVDIAKLLVGRGADSEAKDPMGR
ncbi:MAG: hypothetical protein LQ346_004442 [Caloplaca aetnensis]|nr:MAG: hypothetical protein LQ346_004442 [Caloplaca aetnensis]